MNFVLVPSEVTSFKNESRTAHSISLVWIEPTMNNGNIQSYLVSIFKFSYQYLHVQGLVFKIVFVNFVYRKRLNARIFKIKNSIKFITQTLSILLEPFYRLSALLEILSPTRK